jgi:hypothetical protein
MDEIMTDFMQVLEIPEVVEVATEVIAHLIVEQAIARNAVVIDPEMMEFWVIPLVYAATRGELLVEDARRFPELLGQLFREERLEVLLQRENRAAVELMAFLQRHGFVDGGQDS